MGKVTFSEVAKVALFAIFINFIVTLFLFTWVTDDDVNNIPEAPLSRFVSLFYYSITTFSTTGYGDITAKSNRMKLFISLYMILIFAVTIVLFV
jgi:hypothetical protein